MVVFLDRGEWPRALYVCCPGTPMLLLGLASALSWKIHAHKPSTHVLMPLKLGALREVARNNIDLYTIPKHNQGKVMKSNATHQRIFISQPYIGISA